MSYLRHTRLRKLYSSNFKPEMQFNHRKSTTKYSPHSSMTDLRQNSIIISLSKNIYRNLALEDWIYKHYDLNSKQMFMLLLWFNHPSVVIGRHQNPWIECSMNFSNSSGISVARRNSGGGSVYHDFGNLNCCFLSPRKKYDRIANLNLICESLKDKWPLNLIISPREDVFVDEKYKISGTASKLGRNNAYHHCTILINVDLLKLHQALRRNLSGIESRATASVKSEVKNLQSICPEITISEVMTSVSKCYQDFYKVPQSNMLTVEPSEDLFPGIDNIETHLSSWDWCFGKTPKFGVTKSYPSCPSFSKLENKNSMSELELKLVMHHGVVENFTVRPQIISKSCLEKLKMCIVGARFCLNDIQTALENWIQMSDDKVLCRFIKSCVVQLIHDVHR